MRAKLGSKPRKPRYQPLSPCSTVRQRRTGGLPHMLVGCMRVSSADERQSVDLQRDVLLAAGVDPRQLHLDKAPGARDDRPGLRACLAYLEPAARWWSGSWAGSAARCRTCWRSWPS